MFKREIPILFLKATIKKMIMVPGYYRNGTYVAPHQKMVHYDPDKDYNEILSGGGSHSQKQAHKQLHATVKDFHKLPHHEQHDHILSLATNIQTKATAGAQVSTFMSKVKSGAMPTDSEFAAFVALPVATFKEKMAILDNMKTPAGFMKKLSEKASAYVSGVNQAKKASKEPAKPSAEELAAKKAAQGEHDHYAKLVGDAASGPKYLKEAYKDLATGNHAWELKHPKDQHSELMALYAKKQGAATASAAVSGWKKNAHAGKAPTNSQWAAFMKLDEDKKASMGVAAANAAGGSFHLIPPISHFKDAPEAPKQTDTFGYDNVGTEFSSGNLVYKFDGEDWIYRFAGEQKAWGLVGKKDTLAALNSGHDKDGNALVPLVDNTSPAKPKTPQMHTSFGSDNEGKLFSDGKFMFKYENGDWLYKMPNTPNDKWDTLDGPTWISALNGGKNPSGKSLFAYSEPSPKEGDTKEGADGTLVFHDGHWHKEHVMPDVSIKNPYWAIKNHVEAKESAMTVLDYSKLWKMHNPGKDKLLAASLVDLGYVNVAKQMGIYTPPGVVEEPAKTAEQETDIFLYANTSEGHNKFWQVRVVGNKMITIYGKIGTKGSSTVKEYASHHLAFVAMDDLQKEKLKGGYYFVKKEAAADWPAENKAEVAKLKPTPVKLPASVQKLQNIDAEKVGGWLKYSHTKGVAGTIPNELKTFFDEVPKLNASKFHKWNDASKKAIHQYKDAYRSAAIASLFGMHDQVLESDGTWTKPSMLSGVGIVTDVATIQAAAIAAKLGDPKPEPKVLFTRKKKVAEEPSYDGGWIYSPKDPGMSYAPSLTQDYGDKLFYAVYTEDGYQVGVMGEGGMTDIDHKDFADPVSAGSYLHTLLEEHTNGELPTPQWAAIAGLKVDIMPKSYVKASSPKEGDTKQGADGMLVLKDGHWVKVDQAPSEPIAAAASKFGAGVTKADKWVQTGEQAGSNPGGKFKDKSGQEWYCKFPSDPDVVRNELLAAKFYEMFGISAAKVKLIEKDGKLGIASKWIDGLGKGTPSTLKSAHAGFAVDAWLANWDVVGLSNDNLLKSPDGAVRVDVGGALLYRAMGGAKGEEFGDNVTELDSLLDKKINPNSAKVFSGMSQEDLKAGGAKVALITNEQIQKMVDMFGPGDWPAKNALAKKLIARRKDIIRKLDIEDPWNKPAPDETSLPVNKDDLPAAKDFSNWDGSGKGLSSVESLNKQNTIDHANLLAFAMQGNLVALKNYQYEAIEKDTGKSLGYKSIVDHPSKWVKEDWSYLVEMLDTIAHPSVAGLDLPSIGGGLNDIANDSGFFKLGNRVATISADKRLGFWMKLAHAGDDYKDVVPNKALHVTSEVISSAKSAFNKLSGITRAFISRVQASGSVNHIFSAGQTTVDLHGNGGNYSGGLGKLVQSTYSDAIESPEGTMLYRWMDMPNAMVDQLLAEKPGLIFQNTDSMCASHKEAWSKSSHFSSQALVKIKYAKGAKALHSYASGAFSSENEITTLPGARFMLISATKGNVAGGKIEMEVLMLPPHEGFITDVENQAKLGKSFLVFFKSKIKGMLWNR